MAETKSLKAIVKREMRADNLYYTTAYLYADGISLCVEKKSPYTTNGSRIAVWYHKECQITGFRKDTDNEIARIVLRNPSILLIGDIKSINVYWRNASDADRNNGVDRRTLEVKFVNGVELYFDEIAYADNPTHYYCSEMTIQRLHDWPWHGRMPAIEKDKIELVS